MTVENQKPWAIKVLLACFAEREEVWQSPPYLKLCWLWEDKEAASQAHSVKQCSLASRVSFFSPGDKYPPTIHSALSRCCFYWNQGSAASQCHRLVTPKQPKTLPPWGRWEYVFINLSHKSQLHMAEKCPENDMLQ